jgi:hypothetical protein
VALALALAGCASTRLDDAYVDPAYRGGPFQKLIVIGLGASEGGRAAFEEAVVETLRARGVAAAPSHDMFAASEDVTREAVESWAREGGYDGVLVTRLLDVQRDTIYHPPTYYGDFYGYWGSYGPFVTDPGYVTQTTTLVIETTLFDAATAGVVYSVVSKTFDPGSRREVIDELVPLLVRDLTERGLLPAAG